MSFIISMIPIRTLLRAIHRNRLRIIQVYQKIFTLLPPRLSPLIDIRPVKLPILDALRELFVRIEWDILQALDFQGA